MVGMRRTNVGADQWWAVPLTVLVGAPAYLDGYAALPLTRGLLDHGMSPGAAMAFLVSAFVAGLAQLGLTIFLLFRLTPTEGYSFVTSVPVMTLQSYFDIQFKGIDTRQHDLVETIERGLNIAEAAAYKTVVDVLQRYVGVIRAPVGVS